MIQRSAFLLKFREYAQHDHQTNVWFLGHKWASSARHWPCLRYDVPQQSEPLIGPNRTPEVTRKAHRVAHRGQFSRCHRQNTTTSNGGQQKPPDAPALQLPNGTGDRRRIRRGVFPDSHQHFPVFPRSGVIREYQRVRAFDPRV